MPNQLPQKFQRLALCAAVAGLLFAGTTSLSFAGDQAANYADKTNVSVAALSNDASVDALGDTDIVIKDPYETYNRHTFAFNDALDTHLLQPVARFYNLVMPKPLNMGVHNFFLNLNTFSTIIDDLLQMNLYQMTNDCWRVVINSTIGIGGLFDVASRMNLRYYENDFGMTLANWGWTNSNYIVLPFYGSYTVRDGFSLPFDFFLFSAYQFIEPPKLRYGLYAVSVVDWRAQTIQYQNLLDVAALDKYVFVRNAYMQRRAYQLKQNKHLGLYDRDSEFSSTIGTATANVDESANIGRPANTESTSVNGTDK
jgi:phospholipid-binding lipoprotein MlaA